MSPMLIDRETLLLLQGWIGEFEALERNVGALSAWA
jgi:hypothetical protein